MFDQSISQFAAAIALRETERIVVRRFKETTSDVVQISRTWIPRLSREKIVGVKVVHARQFHSKFNNFIAMMYNYC